MRVRGVILDRRLTFDNHASAVARSCNYHARAIRHIRHLLTLDLAQTLACSLILSRIDYCNICQTIVQHCRTSDLELTATCCVKLRLSLSLSLYFIIQT